MENSSNSYFSSWPASGSYGLGAASVEPYTGEGSMPPSSSFMIARSDNSLELNELGQHYSVFSNECFSYNTKADLLPASILYPTYENDSSVMEPINLQAFGFEESQNSNILLNNDTGYLAAGGFNTQEQEQNAVYSAPIPTFVSQMSVNPTEGILLPPPPKRASSANGSKSECVVSHPAGVKAQPTPVNGNGVGVKPRVRAPRGKATHPHSINERLRREKISDRMKNLQELVPNSTKADKATMLDEIVEYVKFLRHQVKVLSMSRLGAPCAVVPLFSESQTVEPSNVQPLRAPTTAQGQLDVQESEDILAFEEEVVKLMETNITSAMQYLQNKGLCLMPVALAAAISKQKCMDTAAIPPQR